MQHLCLVIRAYVVGVAHASDSAHTLYHSIGATVHHYLVTDGP